MLRPDARRGAPPADRARRRSAGRPAESLALHVAAVRELFEEAGILLARHVGRPRRRRPEPRGVRDAGRSAPEIQQGRRSLGEVVAELGLELVPEELVYFSHWITPESSPRRFDTRFFMIEDRPGQTASHCGVETVDGVWITPAEALRRFEAGRDHAGVGDGRSPAGAERIRVHGRPARLRAVQADPDRQARAATTDSATAGISGRGAPRGDARLRCRRRRS